MNIQLIKGSFEAKDASELLNQLFKNKIQFHENKISDTLNEEDIKMRERRIIELQNERNNALQQIKQLKHAVTLDAVLQISGN
ncbi:hypothetical protein [Mucilaginibacter sp. KACC 22063]|uniref:hypothetical protein n=1 Tax=Mucilaginibacter sp. KACC 22063 TaxID=3025666 RepID=UPI002366557F|nr:hypothetical protein [Mucilaginibacter sp. KACC 22063]WDF56165.1 hypothetical protein PQ461_03705 [Mucilaginibacter sp. KACC 22063]